jgi:hypothetical protein
MKPLRELAPCKRLQCVVAVLVLSGGLLTTRASAQLVPRVDGGTPVCASNSDCGNPYLECAELPGAACGDLDASSAADADTCTVPAPKVCIVRYQEPCRSNSDCGPAGFTCNLDAGVGCSGVGCSPGGQCQHQYTLCMTDGDCPAGWSCYSPGRGAALACYPPFTILFGAAAGGPPGGGSLEGGVAADAAPTATSLSDRGSSGGCALGAGPLSGANGWIVALGIWALRARRSRSVFVRSVKRCRGERAAHLRT